MKPPGILTTAAILGFVTACLIPQHADSFQQKQTSTAKKAPDAFLNGPPFTFDQILRLVRENVIPPRRQRDAIQNRGVDFSLSPGDLDKLKAAGASPEMLALISERAKSPIAPPPNPAIVRPTLGSLLIKCAPAECNVAVAGASKGPTSGGEMRISDLPAGSVIVDFNKPGYVGSQAVVTIEADKISQLAAALEPDRATREAFGVQLFQTMLQALGGDAAIRAALSIQAEGSMTTWAPDGKSTRWNVFMRNRPDRGLLQLKGGGSIFHEIAYVGNRFTTSKNLKGDDAKELPNDFALLRKYQLAALITSLISPNFKMTANAAGKTAGQDPILVVEGGTETISITLNNDLRPSQVKFANATGLGTGIVTYSGYTQQSGAYFPQAMQIKPDSTPRGVDVQFDIVELDAKIKDSEYDLRKKPAPSLAR